MDEIWVRLALIAGAVAVAGSVALLQRSRSRDPVRRIESTDLAEGVYLFSSASCESCNRARDRLRERLGEAGYTELAWSEEPGVFEDVGVDAVPAVLVVNGDGRATLYPGQPDRVLRRLRT